MKKILFLILGIICLISCETPKETKVIINSNNKHLNLDSFVYKGHQYYLWQQGYDYVSVEHRIDCKKCLENFD